MENNVIETTGDIDKCGSFSLDERKQAIELAIEKVVDRALVAAG